jgi:hypothetical protein
VKDPSDSQGVGVKALPLLNLMFSMGEAPWVVKKKKHVVLHVAIHQKKKNEEKSPKRRKK